jgi:pimeloyl-ACP methyl ester carboxylesterase
MKRLLKLALVALATMIAMPAPAQNTADIGVVLLHGKWGKPAGYIAPLASALTSEGFLVVAPELPWSTAREYDKDMEQAMAEVDAAVADLRRRGVRKIVVGGHSMGAAAALHYAGRTKVDGLLIVALGHYPDSPKIREVTGSGVERAREMIAAGKGDERASFEDFNTGNKRKSVTSPARSYLSYFEPQGPMNSDRNAAKVQPGTMVLWASPTHEEPGPRRNADAARSKLPSSIVLKAVDVDADHIKAPAAAGKETIAWLKSLR